MIVIWKEAAKAKSDFRWLAIETDDLFEGGERAEGRKMKPTDEVDDGFWKCLVAESQNSPSSVIAVKLTTSPSPSPTPPPKLEHVQNVCGGHFGGREWLSEVTQASSNSTLQFSFDSSISSTTQHRSFLGSFFTFYTFLLFTSSFFFSFCFWLWFHSFHRVLATKTHEVSKSRVLRSLRCSTLPSFLSWIATSVRLSIPTRSRRHSNQLIVGSLPVDSSAKNQSLSNWMNVTSSSPPSAQITRSSPRPSSFSRPIAESHDENQKTRFESYFYSLMLHQFSNERVIKTHTHTHRFG